jgi:hypothetical protein
MEIARACLRRSDDALVQCEENHLRWKPLEDAAALLRCANLDTAMQKHTPSTVGPACNEGLKRRADVKGAPLFRVIFFMER